MKDGNTTMPNMPVNATKPASNIRFRDRHLQHLQAARYRQA